MIGTDILPFLYLRIILNPFVLPDSGKGCVTQQHQNLIKIRITKRSLYEKLLKKLGMTKRFIRERGFLFLSDSGAVV